MPRHILITGGTGFIGRPLCQALLARGDTVTVVSRQPAAKVRELCGAVTPLSRLGDIATLDPISAVVNLAGAGIAEKRWSPARKKLIYDSRIRFTEELVAAMGNAAVMPDLMVSGSAVGFYGDQGDTRVTEDTPPHQEFTHELCADWEQAAAKAKSAGTRVAFSRTGLVVGKDGGFMARMLPPFRLGIGGRLGSGDQYMPWIHRADMVRGLVFLLNTPATEGPYNLVAPNPVTNAEFTRCLGKILGRPTLIPVPPLVLKTAFGEMARLLLTGQRALPQRLQAAGFEFEYPDLDQALADVLKKP